MDVPRVHGVHHVKYFSLWDPNHLPVVAIIGEEKERERDPELALDTLIRDF